MSTTQQPSRIYVFGATSMTGWAIAQRLPLAVKFCNTFTRATQAAHFERLNLDNESSLAALFHDRPPDVLIHCGGICDVDRCEEDPAWAHAINVASMETIVRAAPLNTRIVYVSSDHVFSGNHGPYDEDSPPCPISVYGQTRVQAEHILLSHRPDALVTRTGLSIGNSIDGKTGHLDWLKGRTKRGLPTTVVRDESRCVSWSDDLAQRIIALADSTLTGIRHIVTTKAVSREELAFFVNNYFHIGARIQVEQRSDRAVPHLGQMRLQTKWRDALSSPLQSVTETNVTVKPRDVNGAHGPIEKPPNYGALH